MFSDLKTFFLKFHAFLFLLIALSSYAQKDTAKVNLISADILEFNRTVSPDYQILSGNVVFEYDSALMFCDKAHIYLQKDYVVAMGNVHIIINDTTHMYGDTLKIDGDKDLAVMVGNVKLIDNEVTLTTDKLYYYLKKDMAYYLTGGEITDPSSYLTSEKGYYYQDTKDFYFSDSVYIKNEDTEMFSDTLMYNTKTEITHFYGKSKIVQPDNTMLCEWGIWDSQNEIGNFSVNVELYSESRTLKSDSLYYDQSNGFAEAFQNVFFRDTVDNFMLNSHYGRFYETDSTFFARDSALLRMVDKGDTLFLHADSIFMIHDTTVHHQKVLYAFYKARIYRDDFQAISDSIVFMTNDSVMYLYNNPIMWLEQTQMIADTIYFTYLNSEMDKLFMRNNAFIVSKESTDDFQQIKSNDMEGDFVENELDVLWADQEAETLYYIFDEQMLLIGINKTISAKVKIKFFENAVDHIIFYETPEGSLSPEDEVSEKDKILSDFRWEQSVRPKYPADVFRDPAIEPEARELPAEKFDSINIPDSLQHIFPDSLMQILSDSAQIHVGKDRAGETTKPDVVSDENKGRNQNKTDNNQAVDNKGRQGTKTEEKKDKKECFIKRWFRNWKEKRIQKKTLSLQFQKKYLI